MLQRVAAGGGTHAGDMRTMKTTRVRSLLLRRRRLPALLTLLALLLVPVAVLSLLRSARSARSAPPAPVALPPAAPRFPPPSSASASARDSASPPNPLFRQVLIVADPLNHSLTTGTLHQVLPATAALNLSVLVYHLTQQSYHALRHLNVHHQLHRSSAPYDHALHPLRTPAALILRAGVSLPPHALHHLQHMVHKYAHRADIAVISLAATPPQTKLRPSLPDHLQTSWKPLSVQPPYLTPLLHGPALDAFLPLSTAITNTVPHFDEWLRLRRSDWYRYPTGAGVDHTPLGMSVLPAANWTTAPWNVWFSKFLTEYRLYVLHAPPPPHPLERDAESSSSSNGSSGSSGSSDSSDSHDAESAFRLAAFDAGGNKPAAAHFGSAVHELWQLATQHDGAVSFTLVNEVFLPTARSWLCNVDVANMRPRALVWGATDAKTARQLSQVEHSTTILLEGVKGGKDTGHQFGNPGYWRLMLERTQLIGEILERGVSVFAFETDAIWLQDPQPWIEQLVRQQADIVGTINTRMEVSGNFFFLRATLATRRMWAEIVRRFERAYAAGRFERKKADSWTYIENDQSLLTKLVLRNETWKSQYPLSFLTLDMEKFVDGRWYKMEEGFYESERARSPVVINNNFVIGVKEKTERAKKWGHWFWDEHDERCLDEVVRKAVKRKR